MEAVDREYYQGLVAELRAEITRLRSHIKLHAGDTMSLDGELNDWRDRALAAEAALTQSNGDR